MERSVIILAVERIEVYDDVLKIILKPTKKFPVGYFYTDNNPVAVNLIKNYNWCLQASGKNIYIVVSIGTPNTGVIKLFFHQEYAKRILGYYPDYLDHINGLGIDNRDCNLNIVNYQQNIRNQPTKGYHFIQNCVFQPRYKLNGKDNLRGSYKTEPEVLLATYNLRQEIYSDYDYNFYLDRRNDLDILDAELTKKITSQQAIYYHVKRYVESNPWYIYRYNLLEYCKQNNIAIPSFSLDSQGFMINPVTKERLCPY